MKRESQPNIYKRATHGEFGAFIGDDKVIKLYGWDPSALLLDQIAVYFGFLSTNPRIITENDIEEWKRVESICYSLEIAESVHVHKALIMDKIGGVPLCETFSNSRFDVSNPSNPTKLEMKKMYNMCYGLGRMIVMDLLIRNNDRFNLKKFDDYLLSTEKEKHAGVNWRYWTGNYGNIMVDCCSWSVNPIDSVYTIAADEELYSHNVFTLLAFHKEEIANELLSTLKYNWINAQYVKGYIIHGLNEGLSCTNILKF